MKIRKGFVSNSSSSSFVVAFPREPKNVKDVKEILFVKGQTDYPNPYPDYCDDRELFWPVDQVAKIIWNNIKEKGSATLDDMLESIGGGWFAGYDELPGHVDKFRGDGRDKKFKELENDAEEKGGYKTDEGKALYEKAWKMINVENGRRTTAILDKFLKQNKDAVFYIFEYSDNDGMLFSSMEHGTLFRRVEHIKTSYH